MNLFSYLENVVRRPTQIVMFQVEPETQTFGQLMVRCITQDFIPIANATVIITNPGEPENILEQLTTDKDGITGLVSLPAPDISLSLNPSEERPYSIYDVRISAPNFDTAVFFNVEILADTIAELVATLNPLPQGQPEAAEEFLIDPHTLYFEYPPKIPEDEIKPVRETGEIVLSQVVIPEFIIVHDGPPDSDAPNYWVRFPDYIKNVASSEIYATWPEATIYANVLAILSFTLNRVFTEWYTNQGFDFTITSSTAYDHKWIRGRNIYQNISAIVDSVFVNYLSRPNVIQPILTQYCDGVRTKCPNWMTQWGSKDLGDQGYTAIEILRHFYGDTIFISTASQVEGVPSSWKNTNLTIGSKGESVRTIQNQLNVISNNYPAIPKLSVDGNYGAKTAAAVREFQRVFSLPVTGIVDRATWYKISRIYVGVSGIGS
jgi:hypothetical protein